MKKIVLVLAIVTASALLSSCGACNTCNSYSSDNCCGGNSYSGIWY